MFEDFCPGSLCFHYRSQLQFKLKAVDLVTNGRAEQLIALVMQTLLSQSLSPTSSLPQWNLLSSLVIKFAQTFSLSYLELRAKIAKQFVANVALVITDHSIQHFMSLVLEPLCTGKTPASLFVIYRRQSWSTHSSTRTN